MNTLSKTLDVNDYLELADSTATASMMAQHGIAHRFEHPHRRWEYGMAHKALSENGAKEILDVGGGGSIFAPFALLNGTTSVLQVDPGNVGEWIAKQALLVGRQLEFLQEDFLTWGDSRTFDAVTCLSVIEHVPYHFAFFEKLCSKVSDGGLLVLTTDFHPSADRMVDGHIRTYNEEEMGTFIKLAKLQGLVPYEGEPDYSKFSVEVNSYTFASLVLRKERNGDYSRNTDTQ